MHSVINVIHGFTAGRVSNCCFVTAEHFLNTGTGDRSITACGIYTFDWSRRTTGWKRNAWRLKTLCIRSNLSLYMAAAARAQTGNRRCRVQAGGVRGRLPSADRVTGDSSRTGDPIGAISRFREAYVRDHEGQAFCAQSTS
jgi:hypothetical protein